METHCADNHATMAALQIEYTGWYRKNG